MKLISITGTDGTGKSTQCKLLKENLEALGCSVCVSSSWDAMELLNRYSGGGFSKKEDVQKYLMSCQSASRFYFLMHALMRSLEEVTKKGYDFVILDSYWYKYYVAEKSYGLKQVEIPTLFKRPDLVIFLNTPIEVSSERKEQFSPYETGGTEVKDNFLALQRSQSLIWQDLAQVVTWTELDASSSPQEVSEKIWDLTQSLLLK